MGAAPSKASGFWPNFRVLSDVLVQGQVDETTGPRRGPAMAETDQAMQDASSFGLQLLFRQSLVAPLLQAALEEALTDLPWFAGRLVLREGGRQFDVSCCNSGARLVVAATSASLQQAEAAMRNSTGMASPGTSVLNPYRSLVLPVDADAIVRQKLPLASVLLLHLRGGGALLMLSLYHGIADFESLQTFAAHLSAAYNRRVAAEAAAREPPPVDMLLGELDSRSFQTRAAEVVNPRTGAFFNPQWPAEVLAAGAAAAAAATGTATVASAAGPAAPPTATAARADAHPTQAPAAAALIAAAAPAPAALGVPPRPESYMLARPWQMAVVVYHYIREVVVRGGGLEGRVVRVPAARLEQIKQRAHTELLQLRQEEEEAAQLQQRQQQQGKGLKGRPQEGGGGSIELHASATAAAAEAVGAAIAAGGGAAWVSARDALSARITQVMHALPVRRQGPMVLLHLVNMRRRLQGPPGQQLQASAAAAADHGQGRVPLGGSGSAGGVPAAAEQLAAAAAAAATSAAAAPAGLPSAAAAAAGGGGATAGAAAGAAELVPMRQLGNMAYGVWLDLPPCPSQQERLGHLASRIRTAITHHVVPHFHDTLAQLRSLLAVPGADARRLMTTLVAGWRRREACLFAPEGPLLINHWIIQHKLWQLGPEPPLELLPLGDCLIPNLFLTVDSPPQPPAVAAAAGAGAAAAAATAASGAAVAVGSSSTGSGSSSSRRDLLMVVVLHKLVWRQLDAVTGGDLAAAL